MAGEIAGKETAEEKKRTFPIVRWTAVSVNQTLVMMLAEFPKN